MGHAGAMAGGTDDAQAKERWFMEKFGVSDIFTPDNPVFSAKGALVTNIAENVALGYPDAETVVQGWMNSKGHRANILNSEVAETGIAIARSSAGGLYYCQVFGRRLNSL